MTRNEGKVKKYIYYSIFIFYYPSVTAKPLRLCIKHCCVQTRFKIASTLRLAVTQHILPQANNQAGKITTTFRLVSCCNSRGAKLAARVAIFCGSRKDFVTQRQYLTFKFGLQKIVLQKKNLQVVITCM